MVIKIENAAIHHLNDIENIALSAKDKIAPNNRMIYYLCCTIFSKYSFVALRDGKLIGFLFAMHDSTNEVIWVHQIVVNSEDRRHGIGGQLLMKLEEGINQKSNITAFRCAIKEDNSQSKNFFNSHSYKFHEFAPSIDMEIFEKRI